MMSLWHTILKRLSLAKAEDEAKQPVQSDEVQVEDRRKTAVPIQKIIFPPGDYMVTLVDEGLLPERVTEEIVRQTGMAKSAAAKICAHTPQLVVDGVAEETAVRMQTQLQMLGAVVEISRQTAKVSQIQSNYDRSEKRAVPAGVVDEIMQSTRVGDLVEKQKTVEATGFSLRLLDAGTQPKEVTTALSQNLSITADDAELIINALPRQVMRRAEETDILTVRGKLEALGATCEVVWGKATSPDLFIPKPGDYEVILDDAGPRQVPVLVLLRDWLEQDSLANIRDFLMMLPQPVFTAVDEQTAVNVAEKLADLGANVRAQPWGNAPRFIPLHGDYNVYLANAGTNMEVVQEVVRALLNIEPHVAQKTLEASEHHQRPLFANVSRETAVTVELRLEGVGAKVDFFPAHDSGLILCRIGAQKAKIISILAQVMDQSERQIERHIQTLPIQVLSHVDVVVANRLNQQLEGLGANCEIISPTHPDWQPAPEEIQAGFYRIVLQSVGQKKIAVIKAIREILPGRSLKEAKELAEQVPSVLLTNVSPPVAEAARKKLEAAGASVTVLSVEDEMETAVTR